MNNYAWHLIGKALTALSAIIVILVAIAFLGGCSSQPSAGIIHASPLVNYDKVVVIPDKVVQSCSPLPTMGDGSKSGVLSWAIDAHGSHGECMFRKDLSDDFLKALAMTGARAEIFNPSELMQQTKPNAPPNAAP